MTAELREKARRRNPAYLPVPKPLRSAIARGNFGEDDHGPVRPTPDEVRAITETHATKLVELLGEMEAVELSSHGLPRVTVRRPSSRGTAYSASWPCMPKISASQLQTAWRGTPATAPRNV